MRFVNSQADDDEIIPPTNKDVNSIMGIAHEYAAHEYAAPALVKKKRMLLKMPSSKNTPQKAPLRKDNAVFKVLCHLPERYRRTLIIKKNWRRQGMKNMLVLFDTNIILDVLEKRLPFYDSSKPVLERCVSGSVTGYIALHSISNIFYILRKRYCAADRRKLLLDILDLLQVADADHKSVRNALQREDFSDFEDCLQDECAKQIHADYIVTRNTDDFTVFFHFAPSPVNI